LLHAALRQRLGEHVTQKGSLNAPDRLRFDVSQPTPISRDDLAAVEADVNVQIRANTEVTTRLMTPDAAVGEGAMALFGEKYGDEVRVVSMGEVGANNRPYSVELCGGTHVGRTGDIGLFRITGEGAVSAGVRRIEAVTGAAAQDAMLESERRLQEAAALLRVSPVELVERVTQLLEDRRRLEREVSDLQRKLATGSGVAAVEQVAGVPIAARNLGNVPARDLKGIAEAIASDMGSGVVAVVSTTEGKASVVVRVSPDLTGKLNAVELVRAASAALGGKGGGGRPDLAQAGGPDASAAEAALEAIRATIAADETV
jgi:alanyl-tRNA synthetase